MLIDEYEKISLKKFNIKSIMRDATILCLGRRRSGKSLIKGEKVLMFDGSIKKVEDIKEGELVMGDDSTPRIVLETHSGKDTMYQITNLRGDIYTVNSHHILSLKYTQKNTLREFKYKKMYQVVWFDKEKCKVIHQNFSYKNKDKDYVYQQAKNILNQLDNEESYKVDIPIKVFLKLSKKLKQKLVGYQVPIDFEEKNVPIEPYTFGFELCTSNTHKSFIPTEYKCNSREKRLKLLAGIIDAKGEFSNKNKVELKLQDALLNDIEYLSRSLGFITTKKNCIISITGTSLHEIPSKVKLISIKNDTIGSQIKIKEIGQGEYFGVELDGNNRFVLGNFIVTHNSWLVRDIFYHHRHIPSGVIFSGTEEASPFFSDFIPDCFIHSEYDPVLVDTIMTRQKRKIREAKQTGKSDTGKLPGNNLFIVLDDMLHDAQNWKKEKTIKNIFFNGRHYNFLFILTMQYPLGITPELRSNIDYVFIFNEPSVKNRKKIYDDYAGMIPSFDHFCNILDSCTQNHECLVIKTSGNSTDYKDQVFWYKSEAHHDFRVGHPKLWKYHDSNYNAKYEEDNEEDEENLLQLKKKFAKTRKLKVIVSRQGDIVGYKRDDED